MSISLVLQGVPVTLALTASLAEDAEDIKAAAAFPASGAVSHTEVESFCKQLTGLPSLSYDRLVAELTNTALPTGYRHFRLFDSRHDNYFNFTYVSSSEGADFTLHDVLFSALERPDLEITKWISTRAKPDAISGVLDLELDIETSIRRLPIRFKP